ncbi:hypothetical protein [Undibacterium sp. TS12]|uniref:hypothetical protein n=1 Tax=Undibacterium sp. TS12 TaxID=2908202 RepID=UPI001F4CEC7C|nr:hypothetical protein [Undibacterium sp. TS12]MCH8622478.1 hypothetical protein [Undibacterium sp. TS12]
MSSMQVHHDCFTCTCEHGHQLNREGNPIRTTPLAKPAQELIWCDIPLPEPADQDVLPEVPACGMCRTDLPVINDE